MSPNFYHITDDLLIKYLLGEADPDEKVLVEEWLAQSESNQNYFNHFRLIWEQSRQLAATRQVDEQAAWKRFQTRIHKQEGPLVKPLNRFAWLRIAALFLIVAGVAAAAYTFFGKNSPVPHHTVLAQSRIIQDTLPDGSVITLNKHSSVTYPERFKGKSRPVALKGEAFFKVAPDKNKPFLIQVNDVTIKVVGTSFNVRSSNGSTEVIVETGIVQVIKNKKVVELRPKEKVVVRQQDSVLVKQTETEQLYNYYRTKEFVCDNTPLWKLVEVLNEAYDAHIIIAKDSLRNLPLNTTFNNESLDRILEVIRITFNLSVIKNGNTIILR